MSRAPQPSSGGTAAPTTVIGANCIGNGSATNPSLQQQQGLQQQRPPPMPLSQQQQRFGHVAGAPSPPPPSHVITPSTTSTASAIQATSITTSLEHMASQSGLTLPNCVVDTIKDTTLNNALRDAGLLPPDSDLKASPSSATGQQQQQQQPAYRPTSLYQQVHKHIAPIQLGNRQQQQQANGSPASSANNNNTGTSSAPPRGPIRVAPEKPSLPYLATSSTANKDEQNLLVQFMHKCHKLVKNMSRTFPKCRVIADFLRTLEKEIAPSTIAQNMFIQKWYADMAPFMTQIQEGRTGEILSKPDDQLPPIFVKIQFRNKWNALRDNDGTAERPSSRQLVMDKIVELNQLASLYNNMPDKMRKKVENIANQVVTQLQAGEISFESLNPNQLGKEAMKEIERDDVVTFIKNLDHVYDAVGGKRAVEEFVGNAKLGQDISDIVQRMKNNASMHQMLLREFDKMKMMQHQETLQEEEDETMGNSSGSNDNWKPSSDMF